MEINNIHDKYFRGSYLIRERDYLLENLTVLLRGIDQIEEEELIRNFFTMTLVYLSKVTKVPIATLVASLEQSRSFGKKIKDMGMTLIQQLQTKHPSELIDIELELLEKHVRWKQSDLLLQQSEIQRKKIALQVKKEEQLRKKEEQKRLKEEQLRKKEEQKRLKEEQRTLNTIINLSKEHPHNQDRIEGHRNTQP